MKWMRCNLARRQLVTVLTLLGLAVHGSAASAVQLSISSAQVAQAGDPAQLCVSLVTGGQEVAGTQNDLVWDGTCMTLNEGACFASGSHGKQVNTRIQNSADFRMRVLVLSLSDVDPIDDGVLYCCNVQGEAPPGSCCSISVVNTGASDSKGNAVGGVGGNSGRLCTQGNSGGAVGSVGSGAGMGMNLGGNSGGSMGSGGAEGAAGGTGSMGGSGAPAPPANQVLQGGGAPAAAAPAAPAANPAQPVVSVPGGSAAQAPTPLAVPPTPAEPARAVVPGAPAPALAPAAPAPAAVPATPAAAAATAAAPPTPADTPTAAVPTAVPPTKAPPSTATASHPTATATAKSGWFGCQIDGAASTAPPLAFALVFAALAYVRRRRAPHR